MVASHLCQPIHIGFDEIIPGRLLHVRLHGRHQSVDLVGIYQYTDYQQQQSSGHRASYWSQLDMFLGKLLTRNQLIIGGDFNCSLDLEVPWTGSAGFRWRGQHCLGTRHRDRRELMQILKNHSLTAVNTWSSDSGPTYLHPSHVSRIDFLITRISQSDGFSKQTKLLSSADFVSPHGFYHVPLSGTFRKHFHIFFILYHQPHAPCSNA